MPAEPVISPRITERLGSLLANHGRIERYRAIAIKRAAAGRGRTAVAPPHEPQLFTSSAGCLKSMRSTRLTRLANQAPHTAPYTRSWCARVAAASVA